MYHDGWVEAMYYGKRYCCEIEVGSRTMRIFADTIAEISEIKKKRGWTKYEGKLLETVPLGGANTWTQYTVFGMERIYGVEVEYMEKIMDGYIHKALERMMQRCFIICLYAYIEG